MKPDELNNPIAKFQGSGENQIEKRKYDEGEERVYIRLVAKLSFWRLICSFRPSGSTTHQMIIP
jgi:hypothetical protein